MYILSAAPHVARTLLLALLLSVPLVKNDWHYIFTCARRARSLALIASIAWSLWSHPAGHSPWAIICEHVCEQHRRQHRSIFKESVLQHATGRNTRLVRTAFILGMDKFHFSITRIFGIHSTLFRYNAAIHLCSCNQNIMSSIGTSIRNERDPEEHSVNPNPEECDHDTRAQSRSRSSADSPAITMVFSCAHIYPLIGYVCKISHLAGTATCPSQLIWPESPIRPKKQ